LWGRMRSLGERSEPRSAHADIRPRGRSWMGGAAAQLWQVERHKPRRMMAGTSLLLGCFRAASPPIPTFPHKGGRGSLSLSFVLSFQSWLQGPRYPACPNSRLSFCRASSGA
jgi:hypothetical protein